MRAAAIAVAAALCACTSVVNGNGVYAERTLDPADFHGVAVDSGIGANVSFAGTARTVVLSGDENVIHDFIDVTVDGGILRARVSGVDRVTFAIPPTLEITLPAGAAFDLAEARGYGHVDVYGAQSTSAFTVDAADSTVTLAGGGFSATLTAGLTRAVLRAVQHRVSAAVLTAADSTAELTVTDTVTGTASGDSAIEVCGGTCAVELSGTSTCDPLSNGAALCQQ